MLADPSFWSGVVAGLVSTAIVAALRGAGRAVLSWLGLTRVGRAWGSRTTWRLARIDDNAFQVILLFSEAPVTLTGVTPVSGLARWAEMNAPNVDAEADDHLPQTLDAGDRARFYTRFEYDEGVWIRGFVYEVAWFEDRGGHRRGFRTRVRLTFSEPPLVRG